MKIGFVFEGSFATNNGSNHLLASTIEAMLNKGHEVFLFQPSFSKNIDSEYPQSLKSKAFHYCPIKMKQTNKTNFVRRYLNGVLFSRKFAKECKKYSLDLFFIQSSPTVVYSIRKAKKFKKPIIYNIHDVFPGSAYALKVVKTRILNKVFQIIQRFAYRAADRIIVVSEDMKNVLIRQKTDRNKINVVRTWYDSDVISFISDKENSFVKENNICLEKLIVQYAGNVGQTFGFDEFIQIVNLSKGLENIEFHVVGSGVKISKLKELTRGSNICFFDWQPQKRMNEIYSYPDIEIIPLHRGVIGNSVPSKMALALACGKPVLNIVEKSDYYNEFDNCGFGWAFEQNNLDSVIELLTKLNNSKFELKRNPKNCVNHANNFYSKHKNTSKILDIIDDLFEKEK